MSYIIAHYNWTEKNEQILLTNDVGRFCFLDRDIFHDFAEGKLCEESESFNLLLENGFLYQDENKYYSEYELYLNSMKSCLLTSTQLFILVMTDSCNQRCIYCQAGEAHKSKISIGLCKKAIDMAVQSPVSKMTIEFQGGEPTLNPEALYFTVPYARKVFEEHGKRADFVIVSNLTEPDPKLIKWLIDQDVHISTSLDGNRIVHEYNRPLASSLSSYDAWHSGMELYKNLCLECGKRPVISAIQTTTRESMKYPKEIVDEYLANGMDHLYIRPLTPLGCAKDRWNIIGYMPEEYVLFYCQLLDDLLERCKNGQYVVETTASIYLRRILRGESVGHTEFRSPCGAAVGQMAINFDGNVYTCDEGRMIANMGDPIFRLGTVENSYRELMQSPAAHAVCTTSCIEALPFCNECAYMPYCSVCPVVNYGIEGDLISHNEHSYKCTIAKGILDHLFEIIRKNDTDDMEILHRWADE